MDRDAISWVVDGATIAVGLAAIAALIVSVRALRSEREQFEPAIAHQTMLDHHARIYASAAEAIAAVATFTRDAAARLPRPGYPETESLEATEASFDEASRSLTMLWFLIDPGGPGKQLLQDIELIRQAMRAVRPTSGHPGGERNLEALIDDSGLDDDPLNTVKLDYPRPWAPDARFRVVRDLATDHLRYSIGRAVVPPQIVPSPKRS